MDLAESQGLVQQFLFGEYSGNYWSIMGNFCSLESIESYFNELVDRSALAYSRFYHSLLYRPYFRSYDRWNFRA